MSTGPTLSRHTAGRPDGGQFAASPHHEVDVDLDHADSDGQLEQGAFRYPGLVSDFDGQLRHEAAEAARQGADLLAPDADSSWSCVVSDVGEARADELFARHAGDLDGALSELESERFGPEEPFPAATPPGTDADVFTSRRFAKALTEHTGPDTVAALNPTEIADAVDRWGDDEWQHAGSLLELAPPTPVQRELILANLRSQAVTRPPISRAPGPIPSTTGEATS